MEKAKLQQLAELIRQRIIDDFKDKHMSGNLMDTIEVRETPNGFEVDIPAEVYNMYRFQRYGVIVPTGQGSYASELDVKGSEFPVYLKSTGYKKRVWRKPHNHIGYVQKAIDDAIAEWQALNGYTAERRDE